MISFGTVVSGALFEHELHKLSMLTTLQKTAQLLATARRQKLFQFLDGNLGPDALNEISNDQLSTQSDYELIRKYWEEYELLKIVRIAHERFTIEVNQNDDFKETVQPPRCLSIHLTDGPVSDQLFEMAS